MMTFITKISFLNGDIPGYCTELKTKLNSLSENVKNMHFQKNGDGRSLLKLQFLFSTTSYTYSGANHKLPMYVIRYYFSRTRSEFAGQLATTTFRPLGGGGT